MIKGIQKTTLLDYPGKIACILFLGGCNMRCGYCYNSDLALKCDSLPTIPESEALDFLRKRKKYLEGVVITGGEPTIWKDKLVSFLEKIKKAGYLIKLDTNGTDPETLKTIIRKRLVNYIAMDVKAPLDEYKKIAGIDYFVDNIKKSIELIKKSNVDYEFRTTIVPDFFTDDKMKEIAKLIRGSKRHFIQQYRPDPKTIDPKYHTLEPLPIEELNNFKKIMEETVEKVSIRS